MEATQSKHAKPLQNRQNGLEREPVFQRIDKPTRIDAARRVGYKTKQGVVLVRTKIRWA